MGGLTRACRRVWFAALMVVMAGLVMAASTVEEQGPAPAEAAEAASDDIGSLVIAGGSGLPREIFQRFRALAGDPGQSVHVVVVPTASDRADREDWAKTLMERWTDHGFDRVTVLHTRDSEEADTGEFVVPLREADAVWFGGGRQSRLADTYLDTAFEKELRALYERGGVIGGSSAGAAIMSRTMIAGGREQARVATGFDLLRGAVVDQHFTQRDRQVRLRGVIEEHPALVGVGIDESTALVVQGGIGTVIGAGDVHIFTVRDGEDGVVEESLQPGDRYDFRPRTSAERRQSEPQPQ